MKQLNYIPLAFTLLLAATLLKSCKPDEPSIRCPEAETNYINLSTDELSKVPYTGTDTLYFLDKNGDTNIVVGQGKQYYYDSKPIFFHPECPNNRFNNYQAYKISFIPFKGNLSFEIMQIRKDWAIIIDNPNYEANFYIDYVNVDVKNLDNPRYIDSIFINGKNYGRVRSAIQQLKNSFSIDTTYTLYYNTYKGILFIKSKNENEEYSIINK